ncbi:uncharacterized protein EI97DRAFT_435105 [Westerdykella ornata]|uniref:Uncharacterized protein n=1 Tax=Westerdykella ornata TaxID=318751 RepID=A0A6A6JE53_WESOR|nr:uncharacterized protein EI97DRAFT_435105 [Westerdykella ornata]KAF2274567.1 hypothetical protein EI97DRAFT_435105 [Westerdykella ornata]
MLFLCLTAVLLCVSRHLVDARSVSAHSKVSNTARSTQSDWENDNSISAVSPPQDMAELKCIKGTGANKFPSPCRKSSTILPRQDGDFSQGLLTISTDSTVVHADQHLSDLVKNIIGSSTCPRRAKRGPRVFKRDAITDCIVTTATLLAQNAQYVHNVIELLQGNPIPAEIKHMDSLPQWSDEAQAAAFLRSALIGVGLLEQAFEVIDTATQLWFVYVTMNFAIQQIWNHPDNFKNFALGRSGSMKLSCPAVEDVSCSHVLCEGGDDAVCTAFLQGCSCTKSDCPTKTNGKYGLFCQECGGADSLSGRCNGNNGQYKGCACIEPDDDPYTVDNAAVSEFETIFKDGDFTFTPPPPAPDQITCYKQADGVKDDPTKWKFVDQALLDANIQEFCKDLGNLNNAAGGSFERSYNTDSLNSVIIRASWDTGYVTVENCTEQLRALSADCDWDPTENQYNWKWGGEFLKNSLHWYIIPQANRVAIYTGDGDNWWRDGDDRHWRTITQQKTGNDIATPRVGKNGKPYDMIILHQCLHDMRRRNWDGGQPHDCAGLVNFSGSGTIIYNSWTDCFDNTWQLNSWGWMQMGVVTMYGEHRGGAAGPAGAHCWQGTDKF